MRFVIKLLVSMAIIVFCSQIGRKMPTLAGLIATAPITSLIVLLWLYSDRPGDFNLMVDYTKGVLWGIIPTIFFFVAALICFRKELALWIVLPAGFTVWLIAAAIHQWILGK
ncbi:MAG: hypothetical protein GWO86_03440 [Planctomycetes bacterium]|nr:hypothetical protein [Planctomycetota bacterium]